MKSSRFKSRFSSCGCSRGWLAVVGLGVVLAACATAPAAIIPFVADPINSANEVICGTSTAPGSGIGVFNLDDVTGIVRGKVIYSGLQSPETGAHIHGAAAACVNAGVIFPLPLGTPKNITYGPLTAAQRTDMLNHLHYINIHTQAVPGGQIRGQLVRLTAGAGACCLKTSTECLVTDAARCQALGGTFQGVGTTCTGPQGCCLPNGDCVMVDPICCDDLGGVAQGPGTACTGRRACCNPLTGGCIDVDPLCCDDLGGIPQAPGATCANIVCPPPVCEPDTGNPAQCKPVVCPTPTDVCQPRCVKYNPTTGQTTVLTCECGQDTECHVSVPLPLTGGEPQRGGGNPCIVPDNGMGTVTLPPAGCAYLSPDDVHKIVDGLPAGTTIQLAPIHQQFICRAPSPLCSFFDVDCSDTGGSLGGERECASSQLTLNAVGTGTLAGYMRTILLPVDFETHIAPRMPGQPVQSFDTDMFQLMGQLPSGDPDFDLLRITGGTNFGLPSPGHTTLTQLPGGNWHVDSFFDITYRIDFVGAPGGPLAGRSGSTTATIRMATGPGPSCVGGCPPGFVCEQTRVPNPDGTIDICCTCVSQPCEPDPLAPDRCNPIVCPVPGQECRPRCIQYNPATGQSTVVSCECMNPNDCHAEINPGMAPGTLRGGGNPCVVPDNGSGTVTLPPPGCDYLSPDDVHRIIDGLPLGTTIELAPIHRDFICHSQAGTPSVCSFPPPIPGVDCDEPGGSLGGEKECADSNLVMQLNGTGTLAGFMRLVNLPMSFETHTAPRMPGQPIQSFDTDMFRMFGQLPPGDPDFDLLRITGGTDFGLPSPGHTTLSQLPGGNWAVDSFFDITYRIDFVGAPGGPLAGRSGSTTATIRMATGRGPACVGGCPPGYVCEETRTVNPNGTIDVCCNCVPEVCGPNPTAPDQCRPIQCPVPGDACLPRCVDYDPATGQTTVLVCECLPDNQCHVVVPAPLTGGPERGGGNPCVVPDAGGTVILPPAGCGYLSPSDVHRIIDGLPPGTTIQIGAQHLDFICPAGPPGVGVCSFATPGTSCRQQGGSLGGEQECFLSTLQMQMTGTGTLAGYMRNLNLPIECETHVAPRTIGQPVQSFDTDMFRMQGQITGDPDFDLLRITGGTNFGLPSPGHTTLTQLPGGNWAVDSFFDITYRIDFVGRPGGPLAGMSGSTTATIRMATGPGPSCIGGCPPGMVCRQTRVVQANGHVEICCDCVVPPFDCPCDGDLNRDCQLNSKDIQMFVLCATQMPQPSPLGDPCDCADMNGNGVLDAGDLGLFVNQLLQSPKAACPPGCVPAP